MVDFIEADRLRPFQSRRKESWASLAGILR